MVADRHHRDDLAAVQEQSQRPLHDDRGLDCLALVVDAGDSAGQPRIVGLRADGKFLHDAMMGEGTSRDKLSSLIPGRTSSDVSAGWLSALRIM